MAIPSLQAGPGAGSHRRTVADLYHHEIGFYASEDDFRKLICPFAMDGLEADEPVVFAYDQPKVELLRRWLPDSPGITYITDTGPYAVPAKALVGWRQVVEDRLADGARRVRIAGNVPHPGYGRSYAGWDRYEAAIDRALGDLPVWAPCLYDTRITPAEVLASAMHHHHHVVDEAGVRRPNDAFRSTGCLAEFLRPQDDPLTQRAPTLEMVNPTPAMVRETLRRSVSHVLTESEYGDLLVGTSEVVTNALIHGVAPVTVQLWVNDGRVVVHIHDAGSGPADPLVGLLPVGTEGATSGRGLWLAHQLHLDVALLPDDDGFTVRLCSGVRHPEN